METAKLTSKGQLVIPERVRDAVQAKIGMLFSVRVEGRRIVLSTQLCAVVGVRGLALAKIT